MEKKTEARLEGDYHFQTYSKKMDYTLGLTTFYSDYEKATQSLSNW